MTRESRKIQRFAVQLPCRFWDDINKSDGTVLNLSEQGCAITAAHVPPVLGYVSLSIDFLNGEEPVHIELAGVRWISENRCGLEFIRVSQDMSEKLRTFTLLLQQTS